MNRILTALILTLIAATTYADPNACVDLFGKSYDMTKIYPKGIDAKTMPLGFIQVAYESEYLFSESAALLRDYAPASKVISHKKWFAMTDAERLGWLKKKFSDKPEFAEKAGLFKMVKGFDYMPEELTVDSTGNVEIILNPFDSYGAWEQAVDEIVNRYGAGSQQAMMSKPREAAFLPLGGKSGRQILKQNMGWLIFENLRDTFAKLESGEERYKAKPALFSAQSFDHPFLGPMTKLKRDVMEQYLKANAKGEKYTDADKQYIRKSDASWKYTSGPSYRADIAAPIRFSWEIRNAHKDLDDLKMKVKRDFNAHSQGLDAYASFATIPAFDTQTAFNKFDEATQKTLIELFPSKADPRFNYGDAERTALETFRNFAMPLHDFGSLSHALLGNQAGELFLNKRIEDARGEYLALIATAVQRYRTQQINRDQARADIMGALCIWSDDSGLDDAFNVRAHLIGHEQ